MDWGIAIFPLANTIEPLVFAGATHLILGNIVVATVETLAVRRWFGFPRWKLWLLSLAGNYASAIAGFIFLPIIAALSATLLLDDAPLTHIRRMVIFIPIVAFVLSVLIEWFFFHQALPTDRRSAKRSFAACLVAQLPSYALLLPLYAYFAINTLGEWRVVTAAALAGDLRAEVLFVSPARNLDVIPLDGRGRRTLLTLPDIESTYQPRQYLELASNKDRLHVHLLLSGSRRNDRVLGRFTAPLQAVRRYDEDLREGTSWDATDLRPEDARNPRGSNWRFHTHPFAYGGFQGFPPIVDGRWGSSERLIALDLLFFSWRARCATVLPTNLVVLQFGPEIILVDVPKRQLAVLACGFGPTVAMDIDLSTFEAAPATQPTTRSE